MFLGVTEKPLSSKWVLLINIKVITDFIYKRGSEIERQRKAYVNQKKEIQKEEEFINRFRSNVKKAAKGAESYKGFEKWKS